MAQLPSGDEVEHSHGQIKPQNTKRRAKARKQRIARLRYHCEAHCLKVLGLSSSPASPALLELSATNDAACKSFDFGDHGFDSGIMQSSAASSKYCALAVSPQGVDALPREQLACAIEQLPDAEALRLADLSTDELENRLTKQRMKIATRIEGMGEGSISSHASSIGSMMDAEQILPVFEELSQMEATARQLSTSHIDGISATVRRRRRARAHARPSI